MKHPEMIKKEWEANFNKARDRYWFRWMGLYTLGLLAVIVLIYAVQSNSVGAMVSIVASVFVVGVAITGWLARQRALDDLGSSPGETPTGAPAD